MNNLIQIVDFVQSILDNFNSLSPSLAVIKVVYPVVDNYVPHPVVAEAVTKTSSLLLGMEKPYLIMGGLVLFAGSLQVIKVGSTLVNAYQALGNVTWHWGINHVTTPLSNLGVTTVDVPVYFYTPIYHPVESTVFVPRFLTHPLSLDLGEHTNIIQVPVTKVTYVPIGPTPLEPLSQITPMEAVVAVTVVCVTGYFVYRACRYLFVDESSQ